MNVCRTDGIILQVTPFRDYDRIVTIFSEDYGVIKLMVKGKKWRTDPLTEAEFVYREGKSEIFSCLEIMPRHFYLSLREEMARLQAACSCLRVVQTSQPFGKPAPAVYALLRCYLQQLVHANEPQALVASFRLKVLRHEGIYFLGEHCEACEKPLDDRYLTRGQSYCSSHAPPGAQRFTSQEITLMNTLAFSRSSAQLVAMTLSPGLDKMIKRFFDELIHE